MSSRGDSDWVPLAAGLVVGAGVLALLYKLFSNRGCRGQAKLYNQQFSAPYKCTCACIPNAPVYIMSSPAGGSPPPAPAAPPAPAPPPTPAPAPPAAAAPAAAPPPPPPSASGPTPGGSPGGSPDWKPIAAGLLVGAGVVALLYKMYFSDEKPPAPSPKVARPVPPTLASPVAKADSVDVPCEEERWSRNRWIKCTCKNPEIPSDSSLICATQSAEEQERREREAAEAEALLKAEAAARAAEEAAAARARAAASRRPPSESWLSWLMKMFSGKGKGKPPARKAAGSTSRASQPGRGPWYWMAVLLGTLTLYFCLASAYCALKNDWEYWKCRLLQVRDYLLNPCRQVEDIRARFNQLYAFLACYLCKLYSCMVSTFGPLAELIRCHLCQMLRLATRLVRCVQDLLSNLCANKDTPKRNCRPKPPPPDSCANKK